MRVKILDFSKFHNKVPAVGSTYIRMHQMLPYWSDLSLYRYGDQADAIIFQKVYMSQDYRLHEMYKGKKILDVCDPDWLADHVPIKETIDNVDAVTCPTESLANVFRQMTDKPVVVIPDRFDLNKIPPRKPHRAKAKSIVWFGYSHNIDSFKPVIKLAADHNIHIHIVSDQDPYLVRWGAEKDAYTYHKYDEDTIYQTLQKADFAVIPKGFRAKDKFKSNNRTVKAILAGLPVAQDLESFEAFIDPANRTAFIQKQYKTTQALYDIQRSVEQYKELLESI